MQDRSTKLKTLIISDIHLGTQFCKAEQVLEFLSYFGYETLILNGDIIDGWSLKRKGGWQESHSKVLNKILELIENDSVQVHFLKGNHDEQLEAVLDFPMSKLNIITEHIHKTKNGDYLVTHGDRFDSVTQNYKWVAILGDIAYQFLMGINKIYNRYRSWRGKPYYSISKAAKAAVKSIVSSSDQFEKKLIVAAKEANCTGIICGHIHTAENREIEGIHYLNSGDWVESLTAIGEFQDGTFEILSYELLNS